MSKKQPTKAPETNDEFEAALKSEPKVFDTVTLGIAKTKDGYSIVKTYVNANSLEAGSVEILDTAENKWEANEKFKINVIKQGIL